MVNMSLVGTGTGMEFVRRLTTEKK